MSGKLAEHFTTSSHAPPIFETFTLPKVKRQKPQDTVSKRNRKDDSEVDSDLDGTAEDCKTKVDRSDQDKYTVYVGNLPTDYTTKKLKKLFKDVGEVRSVRIRAVSTSKAKVPAHMVLKDRISSVSSLYGYVVFDEVEHTKTAVEKFNGFIIGKRHITVDLCDKSRKDCKSTVFVTNLHSSVDEEILRIFFTECGSVTKVHIVSDRITGSSKNFGFVTFKEKSGLILALKKQGNELQGRNVVVRKANSKHEKLKVAKRVIHKSPKGVGKNKSVSSFKAGKNAKIFTDVKKDKITDKKPKKSKVKKTGNSKPFKKFKKHSKKSAKIVRNPLLPNKPRFKKK